MIEVWKPRPPFDVLTEIAELIENLTETNANMAMLRSGGDLEVTGFLTIDHVTFHPRINDFLTTSGSAVRWEGTGLGLIIGRGCENLRTKDQELWSMAVLTKHGSFTGAR